ncbi:helix-turn-helix domain-containing protein [Planctomicrobium piriforme]|uniref:helix-turn-helix domain-containing protein n=1 Tax=Planctomicrobium piriforme TaxID=1576369 RepID=UPI000B8820CD|nr:helix-turn-helix transcriptional regulator [Planctomicrobium piriforme]
MKNDLRLIGENIRRIRESRGLSQEQLGTGSGSHRNYIGAVERGERNPTISKVLAIVRALECSFPDLLEGVATKQTKRVQK